MDSSAELTQEMENFFNLEQQKQEDDKKIIKVRNDKNVYVRACPGLVELIESDSKTNLDSLPKLHKALSYLKNLRRSRLLTRQIGEIYLQKIF